MVFVSEPVKVSNMFLCCVWMSFQLILRNGNWTIIKVFITTDHNIIPNKMARLRFPGRPGYRFGRCGIHYGAFNSTDCLDSSTKLILNVHRGLKYFHELFGESDEVNFITIRNIFFKVVMFFKFPASLFTISYDMHIVRVHV